jgi:gamma-glutamyltranspeptidase/glutathione hydrolase
MRDGIADPDFVSQPVDEWLNPNRLAAAARRIDRARALEWPQPFRRGDTVFFGAIDGEGRSVSALQSIYFDWGSGVPVGDTGILWQNRGAAFSLQPNHANRIAPGKRPFYTLNPGLGLLHGKPALIYGTQGADGQPQTLTMILTRLLDYHQDPLSALAGPRFLLGRTFSDSRDSLKLESDVGEVVGADLAERGHQLSLIEPQSPLAGQAGVIAVGPDGTFRGAHDPRGEGNALGF